MAAPAFIGLTGAIGSGKSEALSALERLGAAVLSTDEVAHEAAAAADLRAMSGSLGATALVARLDAAVAATLKGWPL